MDSTALRASTARPALLIDAGGISVGLESAHRGWRALARQRYRAFETSAAPEIRLVYTVDDGRDPSPESLYEGRRQPLRSDGAGLAGGGFSARLTGRSVEAAGPLATYPVDHLLRALWYRRFEGGLIVHAAALARDGRGFLCAGESGSGKSTLAALFPGAALADEFAAVRLTSTGARLAGLPFWVGRPGEAELAAIHLLRHGRRHRRRRLTPAAAFDRLRSQVSWPSWDPALLRRAFTALADLVARVPVWELRFRPQRSVWPVLSGEGER